MAKPELGDAKVANHQPQFLRVRRVIFALVTNSALVLLCACGDTEHGGIVTGAPRHTVEDRHELSCSLPRVERTTKAEVSHGTGAAADGADKCAAERLIQQAVAEYAARMEHINALYRGTNLDALAHIRVTPDEDAWWWCGAIRNYAVCAATYAAITNALAQVYAQCHTPAERLYVRRALGEVAIEAFDYEYAIQVLLPASEEAVPDDRAALEEYALNLHTAATRIYEPLCQFSDAVCTYEHLMRMKSDMAKAYGYSRLAAHVARTDVLKARALLAEGRTHINPASSWYRMLDNVEASLEGIHAFHQNPATRELMPESARELARLQRDVFFNVPGARARLQSFRPLFASRPQRP